MVTCPDSLRYQGQGHSSCKSTFCWITQARITHCLTHNLQNNYIHLNILQHDLWGQNWLKFNQTNDYFLSKSLSFFITTFQLSQSSFIHIATHFLSFFCIYYIFFTKFKVMFPSFFYQDLLFLQNSLLFFIIYEMLCLHSLKLESKHCWKAL